MRIHPHPRQAFTLVELLTVLAIIAVLVALTAAGIFWAAEGRRSSNTQLGIRTVDKVLAQHWKAVIDKASKEEVPAGVMSMAVGPNQAKRARVIWVTLRLKQEFPMSYQEALAPWTTVPPNPYVSGGGKAVYQSAFGAASGPADVQNASCLLLSLAQNRGGVALSPADLGPNVGDTNGDGIQELVDNWGKPMVFFRFPTGSAELDATNPAAPTARAYRFRNPLDSDGVLLDKAWNNDVNYVAQQGVYWFEQLCHSVHTGSGASYQPRAYYMLPTLVSAGKNGLLGLNNDMSIASGPDADDNLYSFKLR